MTASIVEQLRDQEPDLRIDGYYETAITMINAADLIEQQAKEIAELKRLLAEEKEISNDGLSIAYLNGAASARDRIRELEELAKKMADALKDENSLRLGYTFRQGLPIKSTYNEALFAYREVIKP